MALITWKANPSNGWDGARGSQLLFRIRTMAPGQPQRSPYELQSTLTGTGTTAHSSLEGAQQRAEHVLTGFLLAIGATVEPSKPSPLTARLQEVTTEHVHSGELSAARLVRRVVQAVRDMTADHNECGHVIGDVLDELDLVLEETQEDA
jgi:hypothetical protein